jgi:hypothetical protein
VASGDASIGNDASGSNLLGGKAAIVANVLFIFIIGVNVVRTLRHAMWRDELQIFLIAANSLSPWALIHNIKYEPHPALWYLLVWVVTRITTDPMSMQILHIALAIGVCVILFLWAPFGRSEKILLLLSYFLFWEYFVISRNYILLALIGFAFVVLREHRPRHEVGLWLLLGLLANVHALGAIWSIVLAAMLVIEATRYNSALVVGAAVYLILLVIAIVTIVPAADFGPWASDVRFDFLRLNRDLAVPFGAFVPLQTNSFKEAFEFLVNPNTAAIPYFWNSDATADFVALTGTDTDHPMRIALAFSIPIAACWLIARDPLRVLEFTAIYVGIVLFNNIWGHSGEARHHGVVFLAFIATVWMAHIRRQPDKWSSRALGLILTINAFAGLLTLASELRPFSEGKYTAEWITQNNLSDAFLIGSRDAQVSSVVGYLDRPVYYLECRCLGTFIVWNSKRQSPLSPQQFGQRLRQAITEAGQRDAILIRNQSVVSGDLEYAPGVSARLIRSFTNALTDENFWVYRLSKKQTP